MILFYLLRLSYFLIVPSLSPKDAVLRRMEKRAREEFKLKLFIRIEPTPDEFILGRVHCDEGKKILIWILKEKQTSILTYSKIYVDGFIIYFCLPINMVAINSE